QPTAQKKVLRILHYALNPTGYLLLGTSETVGDTPELFALVDRKNKFYSKKQVAHGFQELGLGFNTVDPGRAAQAGPGVRRPPITTAPLAERKTLEMYGPPAVVINDELEVLHFQGKTSPYLEPTAGAASLHILRLARPDLHAELRRVIHQSLSDNKRISAEA